MRYLRVRWIHAHANEPVDLWAEIDDDGWELRKVEIYADGSAGVADRERRTGNTDLGEMRIPSTEEIAADPEFQPREVSSAEFEAAWERYS